MVVFIVAHFIFFPSYDVLIPMRHDMGRGMSLTLQVFINDKFEQHTYFVLVEERTTNHLF